MEPDKNQVEDNSFINDIRYSGDFRGYSFSRYKKTDVQKTMVQNMLKGKVEPACYWCAELICAGHFIDAWETILHYMGKYVHLGNPKLVIYLDMRYDMFRTLMSQSHYINEHDARNNIKLRKLFAEIVCTLTLSNKKHSFEHHKINREEEFDITQMTERLKAPSVTFVEPIFQKGDPKELLIAINEFAYHISGESNNMTQACYWIEWIIEFDLICKKRKEPCYCSRRKAMKVETKLQKDIIWLVWDGLMHYGKMRGPYVEKLLASLLNLFCIKYTTAACKKRRYLLYYAVALLTEPIPTNVELINNKEVLQTVVEQINQVYKQIKKNEESPNTDYLFSNLDKAQAFEKSVRKMEMMDSMGFVPRNIENPDETV